MHNPEPRKKEETSNEQYYGEGKEKGKEKKRKKRISSRIPTKHLISQ